LAYAKKHKELEQNTYKAHLIMSPFQGLTQRFVYTIGLRPVLGYVAPLGLQSVNYLDKLVEYFLF